MASELVLRGRFDDAFAHLLLVGLASILEDASPERECEIWWRDYEHTCIRANDDLDWLGVARIVREHAARWHESVWLEANGVYSADESGGTGKDKAAKVPPSRATLSPRLGTPSSRKRWESLQHDRMEAIDALQTVLDRRYVGSLGEPSYWSGMDKPGYTPDRGASRWEMVPRNRGQEFVTGRLVPLAKNVAGRTDEQVSNGLQGRTVTDEIGKDKADSRSPTGLHRPSAADNAQVWCALFGVSAFPVAKSTQEKKTSTAAFFQVRRQTPYAVLPLWDKPWTLQRYRAVVRSRALLNIALDHVLNGESGESGRNGNRLLTPTELSQSRSWLTAKGVRLCVLFPQYVSSNASAPERWLQKGEALALMAEDSRHGR